jgi:hypothetical protein
VRTKHEKNIKIRESAEEGGVEYEEDEEQKLKFKKKGIAARENIAEENEDGSVEKEESKDLDIEEANKEKCANNEKIKLSFSCFCVLCPGQYSIANYL